MGHAAPWAAILISLTIRARRMGSCEVWKRGVFTIHLIHHPHEANGDSELAKALILNSAPTSRKNSFSSALACFLKAL